MADTHAGNTIDKTKKRSCSVVARSSPKKRRQVATSTAPHNEALLSNLSALADRFAPLFDELLISQLRHFISERVVAGKPIEEEAEDTNSTDSTDPLAHLGYWEE
ncbi:hypothetical protein EON65_56860 [archaeon]|nr:MAG: hypothetical protein EON65_56860 [archaeon]